MNFTTKEIPWEKHDATGSPVNSKHAARSGKHLRSDALHGALHNMAEEGRIKPSSVTRMAMRYDIFPSLSSSILDLLLRSFLRGLRRWLAGVGGHERMVGLGVLEFSATKLRSVQAGKKWEENHHS